MTSERSGSTREFDHLILTRFSVRREGPPQTDDWLHYRWAFFCDALAASVAAQTITDFRWLVYFDIETPPWLRAEIERVAPGLFTPVFVAGWSETIVRESVLPFASAAPYLITTRIDSDDAVATRFVADVQACFDRQDAVYVNLLSGVQIERTGELYRYDEPSNPFISFIEKREGDQLPRTVFFDPAHGRSRMHADILNVVGPPRWMQIIHGSNVANGVRGLRVRPEPIEADFQFDLPFDRRVSEGRYRRERLRSTVDLERLWLLYPYYVREFLYARSLRRAGTQLLPQDAQLNTTGYLPSWVHRIMSPAREPLRRLDRAWRRVRNRT